MQINKMAALATPKKNSYIVKKDGAEKIFDSMGNYIYMQQIEKHTAQYNMLTEPMKSQYLSKNSGTNTTATVLTIIGYAILIGIIQAV